MTDIDLIKKQLRKGMREVNRLRLAAPKRTPVIVTAAEIAKRPLLNHHQVAADATPDATHARAMRIWAEQVGPTIALNQAVDLAYFAKEAVPDFHGDAIRFVESLFEGITLGDGGFMVP